MRLKVKTCNNGQLYRILFIVKICIRILTAAEGTANAKK